MQLAKLQRGLGMWGWLVILGLIGFFAIIATKVSPLYMNEMSVRRIVSSVAQDPGTGSIVEIRKTLENRWIIDYVTHLKPNEVKVVKYGSGRALTYDYEARTELFADVFVVVRFHNTFPMKSGGSAFE